jgi:hypothetical protein
MFLGWKMVLRLGLIGIVEFNKEVENVRSS